MTMISPVAIVMAAGKGTRMKSDLPKVLFPACGRPMIEYVLQTLTEVGVRRTLVVGGYRAELVREKLAQWPGVEFALQSPQLGTGHAVMVCKPALENYVGQILILTGDTPLVQPASLQAMFDEFERTRPACLMGTALKENPAGLG